MASVQAVITLGIPHITALAIFASYFVIIGFLFLLILSSRPKSTRKDGLSVNTFQLLTVASLIHTWYYMFMYIHGSFLQFHEHRRMLRAESTFERVVLWLMGSELFEEAWAAACFGKINWWWSQQICLYTAGAWLAFLWSRGKAYRIKHVWAYMLLGQLVAISVASNLFYVAVLRSMNRAEPEQKTDKTNASSEEWASPSLVFATISALGFTFYIPSTMYTSSFLPVLLLVHAVIFAPIFALHRQESDVQLIKMSTLYTILIRLSMVLHFRTTLAVYDISLTPTLATIEEISKISLWPLFQQAYDILHSHPAQASIGWDVIWTGVSLIAWSFFVARSSSSWVWEITSVLQLPLTGVGAVGCLVFNKPTKQPKAKSA